jgi:hypothetical protein
VLAVAQLALPLAYFFISPENPHSSLSLLHLSYIVSYFVLQVLAHVLARIRTTRTVSSVEDLRLIGAGFGNRTSDRDDPSCPEEGEVRPWCTRRLCGLRNGNVRQGYIRCPG